MSSTTFGSRRLLSGISSLDSITVAQNDMIKGRDRIWKVASD
jgi:hypothetical protein